jgi:hypothetical protein
MVRVLLKFYRRKGHNSKKVVIVGAGKNGLDLFQVMKNDLAYGFDVAGFLMIMFLYVIRYLIIWE